MLLNFNCLTSSAQVYCGTWSSTLACLLAKTAGQQEYWLTSAQLSSADISLAGVATQLAKKTTWQQLEAGTTR